MSFPSAAQGTGQQARSRRACGPLSGRVAQAAIRGNNSEKSQLNSARMPAQAVCCGCVFPFISRPAGAAVGGGGAMRRSARQLPRAPRDGSRGGPLAWGRRQTPPGFSGGSAGLADATRRPRARTAGHHPTGFQSCCQLNPLRLKALRGRRELMPSNARDC